MRVVVQRVSYARVSKISGENREVLGEIGKGMVIFLGVGRDDTVEDARYLSEKLCNLRIFDQMDSKMGLSIMDIRGEVMIVPEFTIYGDCRKGRRPDFIQAAPPDQARELYLIFVDLMRKNNLNVVSGEFRAYMSVEIFNDGPVTFIIDSKR